ncbi:CaiB/BaiF CoA-transferase family protein [Palleronia sp. LCG004]|uniref:CaiB/BaiF CoA transferase family protein n=1 Tax=Palleronia sp. LCG004 TaxID=3079304 RepID=UPI002942334C|nr:CaiB/BaiF CoA-transferase family protein [Palleronia sp. LCG004]WOI55643.1 CaiB/BaiF CoA-transferase family protein [Palleronia sp. LCG004]
MEKRDGPLAGLRVVEFTGIGPVPYAAMLLADLGAEVIRIDRPGGYPALGADLDFASMRAASIFYRSRPLVEVDLKAAAGRDLVCRLVSRSDALIEGYRPGAMERLGLGPRECHALAPRLAYVRVTGWGQDGPMAGMAGHDLNYLGLSGVLSRFGRDGAPPVGMPPLMGDMAAGALFAVIGLLSAVMQARETGRGQVVDANIVDGSASLATLLDALGAMGLHGPAGNNPLDGGRHYYRTYLCGDGRWLVVGAIEPAFRRILLDGLGLSDEPIFASMDPADDAACAQRMAAIFATRPRDHWVALFHGTDGCVTPVLEPAEAQTHPANVARGVFAEIDSVVQAAPAPRIGGKAGRVSMTPAEASVPRPQALEGWGIGADEIARLVADGVLGAGSG